MPAIVKEARVATYELEIAIKSSPDAVWNALVHETNAWWLPGYRMTGGGSKITLEPHAGGRLVETTDDGASLLWCVVHWIQPALRTLYLHGDLAPDWGGPSRSCLRFVVEETEGGALVKVTDAHHGFISDQALESLESGWTELVTDGLKRFVEEGVRQD